MSIKFEKSETYKNLARAFAGECQAGARYQFLAHAKTFFDQIVNNSGKVVKNIDINAGYPFKYGELVDHFKYTLEDEQMESKTIYPSFAQTAKNEGFDDIGYIFERVASVENCHYMLLQQIYNGLLNKTLYESSTPIKWKCSNCGTEHTQKKAWKICDLCSYPQGFVEVPFETGKTLKNCEISDMDTKNLKIKK